MSSGADKIFSFTSNAVKKLCVYIRERINQNGHEEKYQPVIIQTNNKVIR